jgi:hypothetical protein
MELQKFSVNLEKSTGGKLKMTTLKDMHTIYILMDLPTMVNIIMIKKMVMELPRVSLGVITDNGKILYVMGMDI